MTKMQREIGAGSFDHVGFFTSDIERSVDFWTRVLGFEAQDIHERHQPWVAKLIGVEGAKLRLVHLYGHGGHVEFIQFDEPTYCRDISADRLSASHVCLRLKNVPAILESLQAEGGKLLGELVDVTTGTATGLRGIYVQDPHGIVIELIDVS